MPENTEFLILYDFTLFEFTPTIRGGGGYLLLGRRTNESCQINADNSVGQTASHQNYHTSYRAVFFFVGGSGRDR